MNNTFSIQRFGLLLKRQWLEFGKIYLISLAIVLGIFLTFYSFYYQSITNFQYSGGSYERGLFFRIPLFIVMGILFTTIIASTYFAHLGQKSKAIIDLMTPASTFEKFISAIFFTTVLGIMGFLLLFYLTDLAFMTKLRSWYESSGNNMYLDGKKVELAQLFPYFFDRDTKNELDFLYVFPFLLTSIFLLGSIYFEKFHYIKTTICLMIFCGVWTAIIYKSGRFLFEGRIPIHMENAKHVFNQRSIMELLTTLLFVILTLIFWAITYVRLKEKEV